MCSDTLSHSFPWHTRATFFTSLFHPPYRASARLWSISHLVCCHFFCCFFAYPFLPATTAHPVYLSESVKKCFLSQHAIADTCTKERWYSTQLKSVCVCKRERSNEKVAIFALSTCVWSKCHIFMGSCFSSASRCSVWFARPVCWLYHSFRWSNAELRRDRNRIWSAKGSKSFSHFFVNSDTTLHCVATKLVGEMIKKSNTKITRRKLSTFLCLSDMGKKYKENTIHNCGKLTEFLDLCWTIFGLSATDK